jgi:hypothetical protein
MEILDKGSVSLQKMIRDTRIRKINNMLYMPEDENHSIIKEKINEWVSLQCSDEGQILASLFRDYTIYVSWKEFYEKCIDIFETLYQYIGNKSYCFFTQGELGQKPWTEKSNYWMINLLIDYYINTNKTNFPKELLIWYKGSGTPEFTKKTDYDYYIVLDDVSYSGGQSFVDQFRDKKKKSDINIDPNKILIVCPYITEIAYDKYYKNRTTNPYPKYHKLFYSVIMKYWWRDKNVVINDQEYNLNKLVDRKEIYAKIRANLDTYGDITGEYSVDHENDALNGDNNFMYYFDHKIADHVSSFPKIYQLGTIKPTGGIQKHSSNTHDNNREKNTVVCDKIVYLPFLNNCTNTLRTILDTDLSKLCVEPWYKKNYNNQHNTYYKYILALDFDETITNNDIPNTDEFVSVFPIDTLFKNKNSLIEILNLAWKHLITIYIVSRRKISQIILLLNKFYKANSITYQQIYEENIYGMSNDYIRPKERSKQEEDLFWANNKLENLNSIIRKNGILKAQLMFCDDNQLNIKTVSEGGFDNSILIIKSENSNHVLQVLQSFINTEKIPLHDTNSIIEVSDKYVLVLDINNFLTARKYKYITESSLEQPLHKNFYITILIEILHLCLQNNISIYISSRTEKEKFIIPILNRFYQEYDIHEQRIDENNIFGRKPWEMTGRPLDKYADVDDLFTIADNHGVKKENILFLDYNPITIQTAIGYGFTNSVLIYKDRNAEDLLENLTRFIARKNSIQQIGSNRVKFRRSKRKMNKKKYSARKVSRKNKNKYY